MSLSLVACVLVQMTCSLQVCGDENASVGCPCLVDVLDCMEVAQACHVFCNLLHFPIACPGPSGFKDGHPPSLASPVALPAVGLLPISECVQATIG